MTIMQGDEYGIPLGLTIDGVPATPDMIADLEVSIGNRVKRYSDGSLPYVEECGFLWPLVQSDSLYMRPTTYDVQARVKFLSGDVVGISIGNIDVIRSQSRKEL